MEEDFKPLTIKTNMIWNSIGSLCNLGCQWLISVLIVRLSVGYDAAGIYSLAMSTYNIFGSIAQYRMYTYQVSDVTNENSIGEYLAFRLFTSLVALALCTVYGVITCDSEAWATIALYALYKTASLIIDVFHACDQRHHRMDFIGISLASQGIASLTCFTIVFALTSSVELALVLMTASICAIGFLYDYRKTSHYGEIKVRISRKKALSLLTKCFPVVLAGIAASATSSLPRQALSNMLGNSVLGAYASVAAPVAIIQMGASYIYNPMLSYFSEKYIYNDMPGFRRLLVKTSLGIIFVSIICIIGFSLIGSHFLTFIFGQTITPYVYLLLPMILSAMIAGIQWFINDLLISLRAFRPTLISAIVSLITTIALENNLISLFGPNGVTITNIAGSLVGLGIMGYSLLVLIHKKNERS